MVEMEFVRGRTYEIMYRLTGVQRRARKFRAVYLWEREGELVFSGRPAFGTSEVHRKHVISAMESSGDPFAPVTV